MTERLPPSKIGAAAPGGRREPLGRADARSAPGAGSGPAMALALLVSLLGAPALAAIPLTLPPGEPTASWEAPARLTGFELSPSPGPSGVTLVAGPQGWEIHVAGEQDGGRRVVVPAPRTTREREDLLWVAASLAAPLQADAPDIPEPPPTNPMLAALAARPPTQTAAPRAPATPTPAPRSPTGAPKAAKPAPAQPVAPPAPAASSAAPVAAPSPPPTPPPSAAPPSAPTPDEATVAAQGPVHLAPLLRLMGGLGAGVGSDGGPWALDGRGELRGELRVGDHLVAGLSGDLVAPNPLSTLGDSQRWSRLEATANLGFELPGAWHPGVSVRLGVADLRFAQGEPVAHVGDLALPVAGLRAGVDRTLVAGLGIALAVGLDRDLATVTVQREGTATSQELPATRGMLMAGISWRP